MTDYFGNTTESGTDSGNKDYVRWKSFTCPGSGTFQVVELSGRVWGTGNVRLALYDSGASNLICQGAAEQAVPGSDSGWVGHIGAANITPNPATITGGNSYSIALACDNDSVNFQRSAASYYQFAGDYTGGFPASMSGSAVTDDYFWCMRAGVDAYGATLDLEGFRFRNDDGSESSATWKANQDTNISLAADTAARLRMLVNATGDPAGKQFQLEYRYKPSGGSFGSWGKVN